MKQLDWKSFAIGVLLTTTVMFGTGAATSTTEKWDSNQKWEYSRSKLYGEHTGTPNYGKPGWEPFAVDYGRGEDKYDDIIFWRKRVK